MAASKRPGPAAEAAAPVKAPPALDAKTLGLRIGIPIVIAWVIAAMVRHWIAYAVVGVLTAAAIGLAIFAVTFQRKTQRVQSIVGGAKTKEQRQAAIEQLDAEFKKGDARGIFAKAQLQMQEDPQAALQTLEAIDLAKEPGPVADEARAQRAMLHLLLSEPQKARVLVDAIDLQRHNDQKSKATLASVICEAWARTGQAKRAVEILELFDADDVALADVKPGLLRAKVFAYGAMDDIKSARTAMHQLAKIDARIVAGFAQKGVHPLVVKEAKKILERSGMMPKQVVRGPMR
jgi:hypothetical protein